MPERPARTRIINELGNQQTLPGEKDQFEVLPGGPETVFLGLGPDPDTLPVLFPESLGSRYVECPQMADQIFNWQARVPVSLKPLQPEEFTPEMAAHCTIIRYRPGLKAFPSFWGPLTGRTAMSRVPTGPEARTIWLPLGEEDLLGKELTLAFKARGYQVRSVDQELLERSPGTELPGLLAQETPALFFSVNFKGLDAFGLGAAMLREAGVPVAVWLVDNPFNILPAVKTGAWKDLKLFVTDHTFIGPLTTLGARWVTHLPLAACPELFGEPKELPASVGDLENKLVFVGRSEFPKKAKFFAGLTPNPRLLEEAITMLDQGERPHFHWWHKHVMADLWPGNQVRHTGVGAEVAGQAWRVRCLAACGDQAVIYGDDKWERIPEITAEVRPPLDYYTTLPAVYRAAPVSLNVTGMQLPAGLTQRHFDVWCAGGFLISDANPGLDLFPEKLTAPITFTTPDTIRRLFDHFLADDAAREEIRLAWREHILTSHTYEHRVDTVLQTLDLDRPPPIKKLSTE